MAMFTFFVNPLVSMVCIALLAFELVGVAFADDGGMDFLELEDAMAVFDVNNVYFLVFWIIGYVCVREGVKIMPDPETIMRNSLRFALLVAVDLRVIWWFGYPIMWAPLVLLYSGAIGVDEVTALNCLLYIFMEKIWRCSL